MGLFQHRRGQAAVEFAATLMVWLYIIVGIVDFGRAFFVYNIVANTAREGARYATITSHTEADIISYAVGKAGINGITVEVLQRGTSGLTATPAQVRASGTFAPVTPLIGQICCTGGSLTLQATSTMYLEY